MRSLSEEDDLDLSIEEIIIDFLDWLKEDQHVYLCRGDYGSRVDIVTTSEELVGEYINEMLELGMV